VDGGIMNCYLNENMGNNCRIRSNRKLPLRI
jgi:hypothetical protein